MPTVLVVADVPAVRAGLVSLLAAAGLQAIGPGCRLDRLGEALAADGPDVVVLDLAAPAELDEAVAQVEDAGAGLVVLGPSDGLSRLLAAPPATGWGYLARDADAVRIAAAVRAVATGLVALDPELLSTASAPRRQAPFPSRDDADELTAREREVLALVAVGLTNKAIARRLAISDHTVKFHVASILAKLGAESRTEAVHLAARRGLLAL